MAISLAEFHLKVKPITKFREEKSRNVASQSSISPGPFVIRLNENSGIPSQKEEHGGFLLKGY